MPKKLIDLDLLKDFRQKYDTRLKNGTLVPAKAQIAEQIANVSEDVGSTQEEPFIFQATATDNGLDSVETAPIAKHLEKQGNSVVVNQIISGVRDTFETNGVTFTKNNDGSMTLNGTASADIGSTSSGEFISNVTLFPRRNLHSIISLNCQEKAGLYFGVQGYSITNTKAFIFNRNDATDWSNRVSVYITSGTSFSNFKIFPTCVVLEQWGFTADEITDLTAHPEHFFNYYNGSLAYNTGTLTNSNGRYLKCIGRNQFDEEWENGGINDTTGAKTDATGQFRSKNYIRVIPDTQYYVKGTTANYSGMYVYYYDKDKNFIGRAVYNNQYNVRNHEITTPSNCCYIMFKCQYATGVSSYQNDITISIYYADGTDYDQYFPYEENTYDTGTEVLRSAGSVRDIKLPDGSITRKVGTRAYQSGDENDSSVITDGTTTYYALATPTEEQGTSFAENVIVDNYGSMGWLDTDSNFVSVPQGSEFFYPADYVEFLDSLYTRSKDGGTSADVSNIVVASELIPFTNTDTQLQNAIGGTLRQCLVAQNSGLAFENTKCIDLSTLTYSYDSGSQLKYALINDIVPPASGNELGKAISTIYINKARNTISNVGEMAVSTNKYINIKVSSADETPSGLFAYEKA